MRWATWALVGLALLWALAGSASAHAVLASSAPAPNAQLACAPTSIALTFTERVEANGSRLALADQHGSAIALGPLAVADANVSARVEAPIPPGAAIVSWTSVSGVDGHAARGSFVFEVAAPIFADFAIEGDLVEGAQVRFADRSLARCAPLAEVRWSFGDGNETRGPTVVHVFATGEHVVTLTVTDEAGASATVSRSLNVTAREFLALPSGSGTVDDAARDAGPRAAPSSAASDGGAARRNDAVPGPGSLTVGAAVLAALITGSAPAGWARGSRTGGPPSRGRGTRPRR